MTTTSSTTRTVTDSASEAIADAVRRISVPRREPADSFVLHAPLELMARVGVLALVSPGRREAAVRAITELADQFELAGDPVDPPATAAFADAVDAAASLERAILDADLDAVDATSVWLAAHVPAGELRRLVAPLIVDSLAAAGHAPIGLHLLAAVESPLLGAELLRGPLRDLARNADWRLTWFTAREDRESPVPLIDAIRAVPQLGRPGSDFIRPLMVQVERSGVAAGVLAPALSSSPDLAEATRVLQRAAAWSMLADDPSQAPYGWTHALTMPQAVLSLAPDAIAPRTALAVAATFVAGFRAAHGTVPLGALDDDAVVVMPAGDIEVWSVTELADAAAVHHDAHVVKYTLACVHAAEADPAWQSTYLAAATSLHHWWQRHDGRRDDL